MAYCIEHSFTLEDLPLEVYKQHHELFDEDVYKAISLERCVNGRKVLGGPAPENVRAEAKRLLEETEAMEAAYAG